MTLEDNRKLAAKIGKPQDFGLFINGDWRGGQSGQRIGLWNPATGASLGTISAGNAADVSAAVEAAHAAFPNWSRTEPVIRQRALMDIAASLRARIEDFAMMESLNNGKTLVEARGDIHRAADHYEFYAGTTTVDGGRVMDFPESIAFVHREAIGVVAQIIPWNVPMVMASMKLGPALAAGCTVVLKPAETVCLSIMAFCAELKRILPPGVVNVVTGYGGDVGPTLVSHPLVRKVAFTGSRPTAEKIIGYASRNIIPQTMELGGKSANVICEDADIEKAARSAVMTTIRNKGEVCLAGSRVFAHASIKTEFVELFRAMLEKVRQGDPLNPETQIGAQASREQHDRVLGYLDLARREGAKVVLGGGEAEIFGHEKGHFIQPTILDGCNNNMRVMQEEIFGPVTGVIAWDDEDEMLRQVNAVEYGLGGGIWTRDVGRAHRLAREMQSGTVWINTYYNIKPGIPIGGFKQSGFGRESAVETLNHYTQSKSVVLDLSV